MIFWWVFFPSRHADILPSSHTNNPLYNQLYILVLVLRV